MKDATSFFWRAIFLSGIWSPAYAQVAYEGCSDFNGNPVASISNPGINDIAMATVANGRPVIFYNPRVLMQVSPKVRQFFYAHECAHHALGHLVGSPPSMAKEQQADCWGIRTLVDAGRFDDDDVVEVQRSIAALGRGDWTHLPGPYRAINLRACLGGQAEASSSTNERFQQCMSDRIDSCMEDCTDNYGYSESVCRARLCNPNFGSNTSWARRCRR